VTLPLAFGIGANTVIFSVLDTVLLRPLAFEDPETLVRITSDLERAKAEDVGLSVPELFDYRRLSDVFEQISGLFPIDANLTEADQPERVKAILVDVDFFDLLGVEAQLGCTFRAEDYRAGIAEVAVLSDELWRRRFGADAGAIGRSSVSIATSTRSWGSLRAGSGRSEREIRWTPICGFQQAGSTVPSAERR
jgi:hypothetical protein